MFKVYTAPESLATCGLFQERVFLAGSIDQDKADRWQDKVIAAANEIAGKIPERLCDGICFINPRRNNWDSTWEESIDNPAFKEQVRWELNGLELANRIMFYFQPGTNSPISLLELGLVAHENGEEKEIVVCCPPGYHKKGNVDIICKLFNIRVYETFEGLLG
jgi:hypothetical protein